MFGLAIALILGSPIAFLAIGFFGVSRKRAEESREHLEPLLPAVAETITEPIQSSPEPLPRSVDQTALPPLDPTQGGATG